MARLRTKRPRPRTALAPTNFRRSYLFWRQFVWLILPLNGVLQFHFANVWDDPPVDSLSPTKKNEDAILPQLLIPSSPDMSIEIKIREAIEGINGEDFSSQKNHTLRKANNQTLVVNPLKDCPVTSQVRLYMPLNQKWYLQTYDSHGKPKRMGGEEFYVEYHQDDQIKRSGEQPNEDTKSSAGVEDLGNSNVSTKPWVKPKKYRRTREGEPPLTPVVHPIAVADITDRNNGQYELDFVRMKESSAKPDGSRLTIHFVYTCGIASLPPPTKDAWKNGGFTQTSYNVSLPTSPPMTPFVLPPRAVDAAQFDHVVLVGDSVMAQFAHHNGQFWRDNVKTSGNVGRPLNSDTVADFVRHVKKQLGQVTDSVARARWNTTTNTMDVASPQPNVLLILGSSTWDIVSDNFGQGRDFSNHQEACRQLIFQVQEHLPSCRLLNVTLAWKSPTAVHAHVVLNRRTKWFGPPAKAVERTKYMSSTRSGFLYRLQKKIMTELDIPFIDIYESSFFSASWLFPTDGRHYRPELNQMWFNSIYAREPNHNRTFDYSYKGY